MCKITQGANTVIVVVTTGQLLKVYKLKNVVLHLSWHLRSLRYSSFDLLKAFDILPFTIVC